MKQRVLPLLVLVAGVALLVVLALRSQASPVSTYSTFDDGRNGFLALYNVLARAGVSVERLQEPLALRDPRVRIIAFTSTAPERSAGQALVYDRNDYQRLTAFVRDGGRLVYFRSPDDAMLGEVRAQKLPVTVLDAAAYTNLALSRRPQAIARAYAVLAGHGAVAFDERLHGYARNRSMWSVLPRPVRTAWWIVLLALALVLVDANVRFAPALTPDPPEARDSAAYIVSMASLLRRARAGRAAIVRFAKAAPSDPELAHLATIAHPADAAVLRAAIIAAHHRKDRS